MLKNKYLILAVLGIILILAVSGCTSSNNQTSNQGPNSVAIKNFAFDPATLNVQTGTKVTWINQDSNTHRVVSNNGAFESGDLTNGQSYSFTFNQAGNYPYYCSIHPSMKGTIVVTTTAPSNPSTSTPSTRGSSGY